MYGRCTSMKIRKANKQIAQQIARMMLSNYTKGVARVFAMLLSSPVANTHT